MIECYYRECPNHFKDEPFCRMDSCTASEPELKYYIAVRVKPVETQNAGDIGLKDESDT